MLQATAAQIACVNGFNGDQPTEPTTNDVNEVVQALAGNDARMHTQLIEGENKYATSPIRPAFFAYASTDLQNSLQSMDQWTAVANYPQPVKALQSEFGACNNVRFLVSSLGSKSIGASKNGRTVYNVFINAQDSYANIRQSGASARFIYLPPQYSGPLAMNSSMGFKFAFACRILNDQWLINMTCTKA